MPNLTLLASISAGIAVAFATFVIVEFIFYVSGRYKEKYLEETASEIDEVLINMPPGRIFDLSCALSGVAAFFAVFFTGIFGSEISGVRMGVAGVLAAGAAFPAPRLYLRYLKKQRLLKFNEQLEDALLSMSGSLKAGFSINQALQAIADENRSPISFEFSLLMHEIHLGVTLDTALAKMSARMQCADFELVSIAIITARQTGGELTGILERLSAVIRERVRITNRIRALTAQGRMQAVIIGLMPFALLAALYWIVPDMVGGFFSTLVGMLCLVLVVIMDVTGFFVIRKITTIDI